jgi:hypothetical protein
MLMLSKNDFKTVQMQMYNKARDIDVALFNVLFDNKFPKAFLANAITGFQNKDGGFAHALEPDNYNKDSNLINCVEAMRIASMAFDTIEDDNVLNDSFKKLFNYLYNRLDKWEALVESNNFAICASWYKYNDINLGRFGDAPTPSIIGYTLLLTNNKSVYFKKANEKAKTLIDKFLNKESFIAEEIKSYTILYRGILKHNLYADKLEAYKDKLYRVAYQMVEKNKDNYSKPGLLPLDVFFEYTGDKKYDDLIDQNLDYIITSIKPHGLWEAPFDWSSEIAEGATAQIKWIGVISVINSYYLKKFNRIED